jgi:magnesium chelatase family protein
VPQVEKYMSKISGPLLDRIDIHIEVPAVPFKELSAATPGTSGAQMREAVVGARAIQRRRFVGTATRHNGQMTHRQIRAHCQLDDSASSLLRATMTELGLSARAHDKILRVARTIADLDASDGIQTQHLNEAIHYRMLDRQLWT